jgi:hypothetical protein
VAIASTILGARNASLITEMAERIEMGAQRALGLRELEAEPEAGRAAGNSVGAGGMLGDRGAQGL